VSFQQLDKNMIRVKEMFPGAEFCLLTHSHGVNRAGKYEMLSDVFDYRNRENFSFFFIPRELKGERFDAVVVPVTNKTGAGFLNVFLLALRLKGLRPGTIYCCNLVSDIWPIPGRKIIFQAGRSFFFSAAALVLGFVSILILPFLLLSSLIYEGPPKTGKISKRGAESPPCCLYVYTAYINPGVFWPLLSGFRTLLKYALFLLPVHRLYYWYRH
jgi:hypothetical protein